MNMKRNDKKVKEVANSNESLFVATPVHSQVSLHYMKSCLDLQKDCLFNNLNITFQLMQSSLVTQGRNLCVSAFLESDAKQMCFIDADICFNTRSIYRMYESPHEVTVVPYPMKTLNRTKFDVDYKKRQEDNVESMGLIFPVELENPDSFTLKEGFMKIKRGPAGCMMIKRSAFEKMKKAYPELSITQHTIINGKMATRPNYYNFFDSYHDPETKTYTGEDFYFCKLWTKLGGEIYALVDEPIQHMGEYPYQGKLLQEFHRIGNEDKDKKTPPKEVKPPLKSIKGKSPIKIR